MMPEPSRKKMCALRNTGSVDVGSAIVFWHEAEGSPPAVRAISLKDLEPINGNSVTEKTICRARYRGVFYHCIVIWIEEDKTPDELASMRLFPATSERTYEDKGYSWAAELGLVHMQKPQSVGEDLSASGTSSWMQTDVQMPELRSSSWDSRSEGQEESTEMENGVGIDASASLNDSEIDQSNGLNNGANGMMPLASSRNGQQGSRRRKETAGDLSAQVIRMQETIAALRQQKKSGDSFSSRKHLPTFLNSLEEEQDAGELYDQSSPTMNIPSPTNGDFSDSVGPVNDELMTKMLAQSTWKKALKLGMKTTFTTEELLTSVPTERGGRMSKNGKKALDQQRLAMVKNMVAKYCEQKDIWLPTHELVHQELGGILFSIREANNPTAKITKLQSFKKEGRTSHLHSFRGMGRKTSGAPIRPGYSFKVPTFPAAMDLSDRDGKSSKPPVVTD